MLIVLRVKVIVWRSKSVLALSTDPGPLESVACRAWSDLPDHPYWIVFDKPKAY